MTRQQDEYHDNQEEEYYGPDNDIEGLNETVYMSADEGDYEEYSDYDRVPNETQEQYYTPNTYVPHIDNGGYYTAPQHLYTANPSQVVESHVETTPLVTIDHGVAIDSTNQVNNNTYPDAGYETEVGQNTIPQLTAPEMVTHQTDRYTHNIIQDGFMGQFDDIDVGAYPSTKKVSPQAVRSTASYAEPRTVLIHNRPQTQIQQPLVVHQVHNLFGATSSPKKPLPPPGWPVRECHLVKEKHLELPPSQAFFMKMI